MRKALGYAIFVGVTALIVIGAWRAFEARESRTSEVAGEPMFPAFAAAINDSAAIKGLNEDGSYTIERRDGTWVLVEKNGYPANQTRVREMLVGLSQLRLAEPKTSKPERYEKLGLTDPGTDGSRAQQISVVDAGGKTLVSLIVGDSKAARGEPNLSEYYVRRLDDAQTWTALGSLPRILDTVDWLDDTLIEFDSKRIRSVTVRHADGEVVRVLRKAGELQGYVLENVPAGREVDSGFIVRNVASTLANLAFDDLTPGAEDELQGDDRITFGVTTWDGLQFDLDTVKVGDDRMVRARAERVAAVTPPNGAADGKSEGTAAERDEDKVVMLEPDAVDAEVARLNGRWGGYTFRLGDWRLAPSYKRTNEFLKPLAEATPAPETSSPETSSPETSSPETSSPETSSPETSSPAPAAAAPGASAPATPAPEATAPAAAAEGSFPASRASEATARAAAAAEASSPATPAPAEPAPESTAPAASAPTPPVPAAAEAPAKEAASTGTAPTSAVPADQAPGNGSAGDGSAATSAGKAAADGG